MGLLMYINIIGTCMALPHWDYYMYIGTTTCRLLHVHQYYWYMYNMYSEEWDTWYIQFIHIYDLWTSIDHSQYKNILVIYTCIFIK